MTEKRFKLDSEIGFIDTQKCGGDTMTLFEVVVELNKLNEENEQLKSICKDHRDHAIDFKADCVRLEKENDELKENCKNYNWYKQYKTLLNENDELKVELNKLEGDLDYYKAKCASLETGLLQTQRDVEWLRDNTVWEQMPTNRRTFTKTVPLKKKELDMND